MSVRLEFFQYLPRGIDGWGSRLLHFGAMFTAVQAPNGAGKTPIMKGIMQGLGHEVELPPEVLKRCESAQLGISIDGKLVTMTRTLGDDFELRVDDGENTVVFTSQADYARWFCGQFSQNLPRLTTKQSQATELYATTLLPSLWVDQDHGWTTDYWVPPSRNFIRDQRQEVIRFLVGLVPRHPFRPRTEFERAKRELERTEKALEMQRFIIDRLHANEQLSVSEEQRLVERRARLQLDLEENSEAIEAIRISCAGYDREISVLEERRNDVVMRSDALAKRRVQLNLVLSELDGEEDILTANVQATELMRQFCAREDCQMFRTSERSYGRSLLFLRDQIKDLKLSDHSISGEMDALEDQARKFNEEISGIRSERDSSVNSSPHQGMIVKLNTLAKELVGVELRLAKIQQYTGEVAKFERLIDQREQAAAAVAETRPAGGGSSSATADVRMMLSDSMQDWLGTLGTKNTKSAYFDDDFTLFVDGERFSATTHQSGSTRTRIVLAFHATLLEVSLSRGGNHPGWLLFDAPKQHELSQADFDAYTEKLQILAAHHPGRVQVVFSAADIKTQFQVGDEVWHPTFTVGGEARFLGPI